MERGKGPAIVWQISHYESPPHYHRVCRRRRHAPKFKSQLVILSNAIDRVRVRIRIRIRYRSEAEAVAPCELGQLGDCQTNVELPIYCTICIMWKEVLAGYCLGVLFCKGQLAVTNARVYFAKGCARLAKTAEFMQ